LLNQYSKQCSQIEENETFASFHSSFQQQPQMRHVLNRSFTIHESSSTSSVATSSSSITSEEHHRHGIVMISSNGPRSDSSRDSGLDYRDSGTSSPQPNGTFLHTKISINIRHTDIASSSLKATDDDFNDNDDSDSNDSVFSTSSEDSNMEVRDIYLGGSCMLRTQWRRDIAIPLLKLRNITFYLPTIHENLTLKEAGKKSKAKDYKLEELDNSTTVISGADEALMYSPRILDSSRVLLFVITNETRSLAPMTLAAHYIGLAYNVVLCIKMLPDECKIGNQKVSLRIFIRKLIFQLICAFSSRLWPSRITIEVVRT
jgi:raw